MTLDATATRDNLRKSVKKYLIDTLATGPDAKTIYFDRGFLPPEKNLPQWLSVRFGSMNRSGMALWIVDVICATRGDMDGDVLGQLSDVVFDAMTDLNQQDGKRRIPLYNVSVTPWVEIGAVVVVKVLDGEEAESSDKTKFQTLSCHLRWAVKA
jgi:hypothetical protein